MRRSGRGEREEEEEEEIEGQMLSREEGGDREGKRR